jgi:hypothetical protein
MFCYKCGRPQAEDATFCGECGTRIARGNVPRPEPSEPGPSPTQQPKVGWKQDGAALTADVRLDIEEWVVTCTPPDSDGDIRFEAKVRGGYHGASSAHLARLSWIAFDPSGSIPLLQADNTLNQDVDDEDGVEIEAGGSGTLGEGVDPEACQVSGQVVLHTGEKQETWTIPLPELGQSGGKGPAWSNAGAEITGWRVSCSESSDDSASYTLFLLVRNTGTSPLAAVTFRVRVKSRKGDVWSTEHLVVERLAPGEMRGTETSLYLSESPKVRRGSTVELTAIVCSEGIVVSLPSVRPALPPPAEDTLAEGDTLSEVLPDIDAEFELSDDDLAVCITGSTVEDEVETGSYVVPDKVLAGLTRELRELAADGRIPGARVNGSKTVVSFVWLLPREHDAVHEATSIKWDDWRVPLEPAYGDANVRCDIVTPSGDARVISTAYKVQAMGGQLTDAPDAIVSTFEPGDEGSIVLGYQGNRGTPWDVRVITKVDDVYRAVAWRADTHVGVPWSQWLMDEIGHASGSGNGH